jgi:hypothetical protein
MFLSKWCVLPVVAAFAAGCGGKTEEAPAPGINMSAVDNLVPGQLARGAALQTEIRSAGNECNRVARTFLQGMKDGDEVWDAECEGGESYGVVSKAGGDTEVLTCDAIERQTGTSCFEKF